MIRYCSLSTRFAIGPLAVFTALESVASTSSVFAKPPMRGFVVEWGLKRKNDPQFNNFVSVAVGDVYSLGLRASGKIEIWGCEYQECDGFPKESQFTAIAAGSYHSLAIGRDSSITSWGCAYADYGQCEVPAPNTGFVAVAAGDYSSVGLKDNGELVGWGDNYWGETSVPPPNAEYVAIAQGGFHGLALTSGGSIEVWGDDSEGQIDVPPPNDGFIAIAAGDLHSLALKADGSIVAWGSKYGEFLPSPNTGFVAIAAGSSASIGLRSDGSLVIFGGIECPDSWPTPAPNVGFIAIAAGECNSLAIRLRPGDFNGDGVVDLEDHQNFDAIMNGPRAEASLDRWRFLDLDDDRDVDLTDFAISQNHFTGHDLCFGGTCVECLNDADCDDANICTTDVCEDNNTCSHTLIAGCRMDP